MKKNVVLGLLIMGASGVALGGGLNPISLDKALQVQYTGNYLNEIASNAQIADFLRNLSDKDLLRLRDHMGFDEWLRMLWPIYGVKNVDKKRDEISCRYEDLEPIADAVRRSSFRPANDRLTFDNVMDADFPHIYLLYDKNGELRSRPAVQAFLMGLTDVEFIRLYYRIGGMKWYEAIQQSYFGGRSNEVLQRASDLMLGEVGEAIRTRIDRGEFTTGSATATAAATTGTAPSTAAAAAQAPVSAVVPAQTSLSMANILATSDRLGFVNEQIILHRLDGTKRTADEILFFLSSLPDQDLYHLYWAIGGPGHWTSDFDQFKSDSAPANVRAEMNEIYDRINAIAGTKRDVINKTMYNKYKNRRIVDLEPLTLTSVLQKPFEERDQFLLHRSDGTKRTADEILSFLSNLPDQDLYHLYWAIGGPMHWTSDFDQFKSDSAPADVRAEMNEIYDRINAIASERAKRGGINEAMYNKYRQTPTTAASTPGTATSTAAAAAPVPVRVTAAAPIAPTTAVVAGPLSIMAALQAPDPVRYLTKNADGSKRDLVELVEFLTQLSDDDFRRLFIEHFDEAGLERFKTTLETVYHTEAPMIIEMLDDRYRSLQHEQVPVVAGHAHAAVGGEQPPAFETLDLPPSIEDVEAHPELYRR